MFVLTGTILDEAAPRARLAVLLQHFSRLGDDREPWRIMYPLKEVMLLIVCATIAGCDDFDEICAWGRHHLDFLRGFSQFHYGIPCERWLRKLLVPYLEGCLPTRTFATHRAEMIEIRSNGETGDVHSLTPTFADEPSALFAA
jgi:hypothetical protein